MERFISIFENSSPKGSFREHKINYEILQLWADSRYLQSGPLKLWNLWSRYTREASHRCTQKLFGKRAVLMSASLGTETGIRHPKGGFSGRSDPTETLYRAIFRISSSPASLESNQNFS